MSPLSYLLFSSFFFVLFYCSDGVSSIVQYLSSLILSSPSSSLLLNPSIIFFSSVIEFFIFVTSSGTFLYFLSLCWNFHFILLFFLAKCVSFGPLFWTLYQANHLPPFQKVFLWGFNLLYCLEYISLFLHLTCLSVWFYAWNKISPFPHLKK